MKVIKRDGEIVGFEVEKINRAIHKAMTETDEGVDDVLSAEIGEAISLLVGETKTTITVDEIQDLVEERLMKSSRPDVAKRYIIYRNEKDKFRALRKDKWPTVRKFS